MKNYNLSVNFNLFIFVLKTTNEVRCLAKKYAVNNVVIIPIPKVIAKPFTGPEPNANKIMAAIKVVILGLELLF